MSEETRIAYYQQADSWARQRDTAFARSAQRAWIVAGVAVGIAGLEALAIMALAPMKTVVPYTLLVDSHTGFTQTLEGTHPQTVRPDAALTQSLLAQYVVAREGYDVATVEEQYRKVALWSADAARRDYLALMQADNPQGPISLYGRAKVVHVGVESVTPMGAGQAMVRYWADGAAGRDYWVALVHYRFSGAPQRVEDRWLNPLGFQVTAYRRDQEAPPAQSATPAAPPRALAPEEAIPRPAPTAMPQGVALRPYPFRSPHRPAGAQIVQPGGGEP
ncbi:virB8 family protein [Novosphingobium sp. KACC 22771]|uniref:virB8 family protein n=1 Tax=Novosphingobium sp. KACC 22771 TaxID=3025670 RepID=UPI002366B58B|nr:VirB8/TrbF family protein [Novosphingobium sp. KACC 22771]WDF71140.1 VirB8/TrbF family protein [Novosphingobium sp. KACC 22771]